MTEIVKVQHPLNGPGPALIYDKDRDRRYFVNSLPRDVQQAMDGDPKAFFNATHTTTGWTLHDRVPDEDW